MAKFVRYLDAYHDEVMVCLREEGHAPPHYIDEEDQWTAP